LAQQSGVPEYLRVATVCAHASFISGLADLVEGAMANPDAMQGYCRDGLCQETCSQCPRRVMALQVS
jgi:hypothetical protein